MSNNIHEGDEGTIFRLTVVDDDTGDAINISAATLKMLFKKPTGEVIERNGTLTGSGVDGQFEYATVTGDLDMSGAWEVQGKVTGGGYLNYTEKKSFTVLASFAAT